MLDISGGELLVILVVALVVFGPERLPDLARKVGRWSRELRNAARELRTGLESEVSEVRQAVDEARAPLAEAKRELSDAAKLIDDTAEQASRPRMRWRGPKPVSGPTMAEAMQDLDRIEAGLPVEEEEPPRAEASEG